MKINPIMEGTGMVCEVRSLSCPPPLQSEMCILRCHGSPSFIHKKIQLSLKDFMEIKKESHPCYAQWRVMSEWCTENAVGIRGQITLQSAMELRKANKDKAVVQKKGGVAIVAL